MPNSSNFIVIDITYLVLKPLTATAPGCERLEFRQKEESKAQRHSL